MEKEWRLNNIQIGNKRIYTRFVVSPAVPNTSSRDNKQMAEKTISIDLDPEQKALVLEYASMLLYKLETKEDLNNKRKKWIRFDQQTLTDVIGELSYHFNRCKDDYKFYVLDELISHLENYEVK